LAIELRSGNVRVVGAKSLRKAIAQPFLGCGNSGRKSTAKHGGGPVRIPALRFFGATLHCSPCEEWIVFAEYAGKIAYPIAIIGCEVDPIKLASGCADTSSTLRQDAAIEMHAS
jgi:hypothetical protein